MHIQRHILHIPLPLAHLWIHIHVPIRRPVFIHMIPKHQPARLPLLGIYKHMALRLCNLLRAPRRHTVRLPPFHVVDEAIVPRMQRIKRHHHRLAQRARVARTAQLLDRVVWIRECRRSGVAVDIRLHAVVVGRSKGWLRVQGIGRRAGRFEFSFPAAELRAPVAFEDAGADIAEGG